ncbi:MAG TPA: hypothetical protein VF610_09060, partial [Segetibacter sp.]
MKRFYFTTVVCFLCISTFAQKVYDYTATCRTAYTEIMKLKLNSGTSLISQARKENPNNLVPDLLEGYVDFFILFFNEDPAEYQARKPNFDKRLAAFDSGPKNSPFYRYSKALTYMQRAAVKIKFG